MSKKSSFMLMVFLCTFVTKINAQIQRKDSTESERDSNGKVNFAIFKGTAAGKLSEAKTFIKSLLDTKPDDDFIEIKSTIDDRGEHHKFYQQTYKGLEVLGANYQVHGKDSTIRAVKGKYKMVGDFSVTPVIDAKEALAIALEAVNAKKYIWDDQSAAKRLNQKFQKFSSDGFPIPDLIISKDYRNTKKEIYKLAYRLVIVSLSPMDETEVIVDANTKEIILKHSVIIPIYAPKPVPIKQFVNATINADTRYSGNLNLVGDDVSGNFTLDEVRNSINLHTLNVSGGSNLAGATQFNNTSANFSFGNWSSIGTDQVALDVHFGTESVFDYWLNTFSRNSLNNSGMTINSYVHYNSGTNGFPANAAWLRSQQVMVYGDGDGLVFNPLTALDVCAHETGHGITQYTCDILNGSSGSDEPAAIGEGISDIWGAVIEETQAPAKNEWLIGEEIMAGARTSLRNIANPKARIP